MDAILTINSGSSTIKFSLFTIDGKLTREINGMVDNILVHPKLNLEIVSTKERSIVDLAIHGEKVHRYEQALSHILQSIDKRGFNVVAAGHRIVHGGPNYAQPVILEENIIDELLALTPIMPLHQPFNINGVKVLQKELPHILQVGCFDTAFHSTCDPISQHYALPENVTNSGVRRYGFHGLSYEYIATQLPNYMSTKKAKGKFIVAHLGNGATMCAIEDQKSVATSIGFTGLGGLPMGTRCDSIDPGCVLYLIDTYKYNTDQMRELLYKKCGLLGVSGVSADMRDLLASDSQNAKLAIDIFVHRIAIMAGQLTAELQGLDGFIFTAGIGENAPQIRYQVCKKLHWLGVKLDDRKNRQCVIDAIKISGKISKIPVWVIHTDEELMIAQHTLQLL